MRFGMTIAALGAAFLAMPAQAGPIIYGFAGNGSMTEFYHWTSLPTVYSTARSFVITINPTPGSSSFSSVATDLLGITRTITASIVGDVFSLSYDQLYAGGITREHISYGMTATFQSGTLQGEFPTFIDFSTVTGGTVDYYYVLCGPNCDGRYFSGSLTSLQAIPEPATWGLLTLGFGGIGAALRRRRVKVTFA